MYRLWLEEKKGAKSEIIVEIESLAAQQKLPARTIRGGLFDKFSGRGINAQGVALEVEGYPYVNLSDCLDIAVDAGEPPLLLLLDHLEDPQNLGTLMRTAEVVGVHGIALPDRRAAQITAAVSNASAGAVEHLHVVQVTNLNRTIDELKRADVWVAGLDGAPDVPSLAQSNLSGALAVVVGSENKGLSRLTREKCDFLVRLPMVGEIASLNAAVAGSIVLYSAFQARQ